MEPIQGVPLDRAAIASLLSEHARPHVDFDRLRVIYVKLRPSGPVLALLEAPTLAGGTFRVTARLADRAKGAPLADRLNEHHRRYYHVAGATADAGDSFSLSSLELAAVHAPDCGVVYIAFPFDRRLPTLPLVTDGRCLLGPLDQAMSALTGDAAIAAIDVQPIRYKPEGKCVFRIDIDWTENDKTLPTVTYGKVVKDAIFQRTTSLASALSRLGTSTGFTLPHRLAVIDDLNLELHSEVSGLPIDQLLTSGHGQGLGAATGVALRSLHNSTVQLPTTRTVQDHMSLLADNASQLAQCRPAQRATVQRLRCEIVDRLRQIPQPAVRVCHNDFHGANVLAGSALGLIDFEDAAMGDPANDVGSMYAHMTDLATRHPAKRREILAERTGFLAGYDNAPDLQDHVACYAAMHFVLLAYQSLRYPSDPTGRRVESMLGAATAVLSGVPS